MVNDSSKVDSEVDQLVVEYQENLEIVKRFLAQVQVAIESTSALEPLIHSLKARLKDPEHLREKLLRKRAEHLASGEAFPVNKENLFETINDLAGIRILHLFTRQIGDIDPLLRDLFSEQKYELLEGPFARTWDDESREYFTGIGIRTEVSPTLYTSVHYVIGSASRTAMTCEIQVRTLMEEVWGEVDHAINYPVPTKQLSSREQIKVLARVTSSASRLVDSIFLTHGEAPR